MRQSQVVNFAALMAVATLGMHLPEYRINRGVPGGSFGRSRSTPSRARKTRVKRKRGFRVHSFTTIATAPRHASSACVAEAA